MNKVIGIVLLVLVAFSCTQPQKIGYVNNSKLINEYQGKLNVEAKYKTIDESNQKKRDSLNKAYQVEALELQQKMARMSQKQQQAAAEPFQKKWQLVNQQVQAEQQDVQTKFQAEIDSSIVEVADFVKGYAKTNGYNFIFGTSDVSRSVMYGDDASNLTDAIITAINDQYKTNETQK